jgi:hypothetical protein
VRRARWSIALLVAALLHAHVAHAQCAQEAALRSRTGQLAREIGPPVPQTLARIDGTARQLLALRSYLRTTNLAARWPWSQTEIDAYLASAEYRALLAEIEKVRAAFESANPGYTLWANTEIRTLDQQLERWNTNAGVASLAASLERSACLRGANGLRELLIDWIPGRPSPLAAPGLSEHGRGRAIDFQVHRGSSVIAGPEIATAAENWVAAGWAKKLADAVAAGSDRFEGPLKQPDEPWHFDYRP